MYNLFIAIFGGLFYGTKIRKDRRATKRAEAEREKRLESKDAWVNSITDQQTEEILRLYISKPENFFDVRKETSVFYDAVLRDKDFEELYPRWRWPKGKQYTKEYMVQVTRDNHESALRILMAKRGLLTKADALDGAWLSLFYTEFHRDLFLQCVAELRKHGLTNEFVMTDGLSGYGWRI